jgi:hypothetical protein
MAKQLNDEKVMSSNNLKSKIYMFRNLKQGHGTKEIRSRLNIHLGIFYIKEFITVGKSELGFKFLLQKLPVLFSFLW